MTSSRNSISTSTSSSSGRTTNTNTNTNTNTSSSSLRKIEWLFIGFVATFLTISVITNTLHDWEVSKFKFSSETTTSSYKNPSLSIFSSSSSSSIDIASGDGTTTTNDVDNSITTSSQQHQLGGLSCSKYGNGPSDAISQKMVYWHDIPSDSTYQSPFHKKKQLENNNNSIQYMTFEPDGGGWNNIRMAMETVVVLAHAMGRTLVLPPAQGMYLLRKDRGKQTTDFSFADFFHLESLHNEHPGLDIISTEEFLKREAMTGHMKNATSGEVSFPPFNQTNWNGEDVKPLKEWLREVTLTPLWAPGSCLAAFPASGDPKDVKDLHEMIEKIKTDGKGKNFDQYDDNPTPVNGPTIDRMKEALAGRSELCIYDQEMQAAPVIHFMCYHKKRVRLLTHFYSFVFFEDWRQQLWTNRFVRDHLRYLDELQCAAARVVDKLHQIAKDNGQADGKFDTFHVRRGDFQFKATRIEAEKLLEESKEYIPANATLYIATDERKKEFFKPLEAYYNVYYLDDFKDLFEGLNTNYYGMLDQLIASKGRTFIGTYYSTFTGYINRMRGYASTKFELEGFDKGIIDSYYFTPKGKKEDMRKYKAIRGPYFSREFPTAWYNLEADRNIE